MLAEEDWLDIGVDLAHRLWVNWNTGMSRGKYAAAAVHAALTAAGVHPGVPVIVLGGQRGHIERMRTVIRDAGRTEVEPGTTTAGTDYVFEKAHTPTDDDRTSEEQEEQRHGDRDADHEEQQTDDRAATRRLGVAGSHAQSMTQAPSDGKSAISGTPTDDELQLAERLVARLLPARQEPGTAANIVRYLAEAGLLRHSEVPEPSDSHDEHHDDEVPEPSTEDWDNRDDEVNGETRGFVSCGRCAWSMSRGLFADLHEHERTHDSDPQGEPSDADLTKFANDAHHRMVDEAEADGGWYGFSHSRDAWQDGFETGYRARAAGGVR